MQITNLSKSFDDKAVLNGLNITIEDNSAIAFMGPSGCGKTTLINLILGLITPDSGSVTGVPDRISIVFQEDRLCDSFSAYENICAILPKSEYSKIVPALTFLGLNESKDIPVCNLSGGMRRRVAILRAILAPSELVIMDEPFKGLDDTTRHACMKYVKENLSNRTFILVTHSEEEAGFFTNNVINIQKNDVN